MGYEGVNTFKDIQLSQTATIDASGEGGGNIRVQGQNITLTDGSTIEASTLGSLPGGSVQITSSESVNINGFDDSLIDTAIVNYVYSDASGTGGDIVINSKILNITDGAEIQGNTSGMGDAGDITFNISASINIRSFLDFPLDDFDVADAVYIIVNSGVGTEATGNGGDLLINTENLTISGNVQLNSGTDGSGDAGNININASAFVEIQDNFLIDSEFPTLIAPDVDPEGTGNGGDIFINVQELNIESGAELASTSFGDSASGNAGNITIEASNLVRVGGTSSNVRTIREDGTSVDTEGPFGGIFASAIGGGTGNGGNVTINTSKLIVENFGTIGATNFQSLGLVPPGQGAAGNLEINANSVEVNNGTVAAANANGIGGSLIINTDSLNIDNQGKIEAFTTSTTGEGGIIDLNLDGNLLLRNNSLISASTENGADGGIINIEANSIVAFPDQNNDIVANALERNGGNINITTEALLGLKERSSTPENQTNDIDVSSNFGLDGNISIFTPDVDLREEAVELPQNVIEPEQTIAQTCQANRVAIAKSGLSINGKGGVPAEPGLPLSSSEITVNGKRNVSSSIPHAIETSQGKIQPARGIKVTESGGIILTAYRTNNAGERLPEIKQNCG